MVSTGADLIFRTLAASGILTVNGTGTEIPYL